MTEPGALIRLWAYLAGQGDCLLGRNVVNLGDKGPCFAPIWDLAMAWIALVFCVGVFFRVCTEVVKESDSWKPRGFKPPED